MTWTETQHESQALQANKSTEIPPARPASREFQKAAEWVPGRQALAPLFVLAIAASDDQENRWMFQSVGVARNKQWQGQDEEEEAKRKYVLWCLWELVEAKAKNRVKLWQSQQRGVGEVGKAAGEEAEEGAEGDAGEVGDMERIGEGSKRATLAVS